MFRKKGITVEQFAAALRMAFSDMVQHETERLRSLGLEKAWPETLMQEVGSLVYFAFDFGMAAGYKTSIRDTLRDGFLAASPPPPAVARVMAERGDEYKTAMMIPDREKQHLVLGNVFARHTGHEADLLVVTNAAITFDAALRFVVKEVKENIKNLR